MIACIIYRHNLFFLMFFDCEIESSTSYLCGCLLSSSNVTNVGRILNWLKLEYRKREMKCVLLMVCFRIKYLFQMDLNQMTCLDFQMNLMFDLDIWYKSMTFNLSSSFGIWNDSSILVNWNEFSVSKHNPNYMGNVPKTQILYRKDVREYIHGYMW